jgi:hypothetical protein
MLAKQGLNLWPDFDPIELTWNFWFDNKPNQSPLVWPEKQTKL